MATIRITEEERRAERQAFFAERRRLTAQRLGYLVRAGRARYRGLAAAEGYYLGCSYAAADEAEKAARRYAIVWHEWRLPNPGEV